MQVLMRMVLPKMGTIASMIFACSTWVTLQSFHVLDSSGRCDDVELIVAALSKNLLRVQRDSDKAVNLELLEWRRTCKLFDECFIVRIILAC